MDGSLAARVEAFERQQILAELKRHKLNVKETADILGIERGHFYKKCQALSIDIRALRSGEEDRLSQVQ